MFYSHLGYDMARAHHAELLARADRRRLARLARGLRRRFGADGSGYTSLAVAPTAAIRPPVIPSQRSGPGPAAAAADGELPVIVIGPAPPPAITPRTGM